jgi:hypothetical protein
MACGEIRCGNCGQEILGPHVCSRIPEPTVPVMMFPPEKVSDDEGFLDRARVTMKKCQVGTNNLAAAHDILADCYGTIGRLITMAEGRQTLAEQPANAT